MHYVLMRTEKKRDCENSDLKAMRSIDSPVGDIVSQVVSEVLAKEETRTRKMISS